MTSHYVAKGKGGRGKKGGLSKYAERLGRKHNTISEFRNAASVAVNLSAGRHLLLDKAAHLSAIHKLPESCWAVAVEAGPDHLARAREVHLKPPKRFGGFFPDQHARARELHCGKGM